MLPARNLACGLASIWIVLRSWVMMENARGGDRYAMSFGLFFFTVFGLILPVAGIAWVLRTKDS